MANVQQDASSGRLVSLGFKKSMGGGLSDNEQKEYDQLQSQDAMNRRMQAQAQPKPSN